MYKEKLMIQLRENYPPRIECLNEHIPIRGNALASGDDTIDKETEDRLIAELEYNPWAWCCVRVYVYYTPLNIDVSEYLGCCSYDSEHDFKEDGYYDDMVNTIYNQLVDKLTEYKSHILNITYLF